MKQAVTELITLRKSPGKFEAVRHAQQHHGVFACQFQQKITDMACRAQAARALVYQLGRMKDRGLVRASMESSMAKLMASRAAVDNALDAIQVHGGYGLSAEYEVGRLLLEAKSLEFGEGTTELHTKLVAEYMLGIRKQ